MLESPDVCAIHTENVSDHRYGQWHREFGDKVDRPPVDKRIDQLSSDLTYLWLQSAHAARTQGFADQFPVPGVFGWVGGEQRVHDGVCVGQYLFDIILHGFAVDAHVPWPAVIFRDGRGIHAGIFG